MHLSQLKDGGVVVRQGSDARRLKGGSDVYALAMEAIEAGLGLAEAVARRASERRWTSQRSPRPEGSTCPSAILTQRTRI